MNWGFYTAFSENKSPYLPAFFADLRKTGEISFIDRRVEICFLRGGVLAGSLILMEVRSSALRDGLSGLAFDNPVAANYSVRRHVFVEKRMLL
ncbi:hypothetical protein [Symmachiella dynata]|uniref:hypothetical protein n=1 Tax=Symmachiella dynata TaxID=2527995 RepID=UPI00119EF537|nr:hypothetical protein [Symmachiella dynata]